MNKSIGTRLLSLAALLLLLSIFLTITLTALKIFAPDLEAQIYNPIKFVLSISFFSSLLIGLAYSLSAVGRELIQQQISERRLFRSLMLDLLIPNALMLLGLVLAIFALVLLIRINVAYGFFGLIAVFLILFVGVLIKGAKNNRANT